MKRTIPLVLMILILMLTVAGPIMGCSPDTDDPGNPESLKKERFLEIMRAININTVYDTNMVSVFLEDIQASLSLEKRLGIETTGNNGILFNEIFRPIGIKPQDLACYAIIYPNLPYFLLGEFNLDDTRAGLSEKDFQRDDREGIEVWWFNNSWYVLHGNLIIFGDDSYNDKSSEWCIRAITGEDKSLDEDPYFRNIIDDFPSAVSYTFSPFNQQDDEDFKLVAQLSVVQGEIVKYMIVWEFTDSATAMRIRDRDYDHFRETTEEIRESSGPDFKTEWYQWNQYIVIVAEREIDSDPPTPEADFSASQTSGEVPITIQFIDQSKGPVDGWAWDLDGDLLVDSQERNPEYTYTEAGCYTIALRVCGPNGCDTETKEDYLVLISP